MVAERRLESLLGLSLRPARCGRRMRDTGALRRTKKWKIELHASPA